MSKSKIEAGTELELNGVKLTVVTVSVNDNPDIPVNHIYELWETKDFEAMAKLNGEAADTAGKSKYAS